MEVLTWLKANWDTVVQLVLATIGLASVIVKLTPTMKDDDALKVIIKFIGKYIALDKYGPDGESGK